MNIFVTVWDHKYGTDIAAFKTAEQAEEYRQEIAAEQWDDEIGGGEEKPTDPEDLADAYFGEFDHFHNEWFESQECKVNGMFP